VALAEVRLLFHAPQNTIRTNVLSRLRVVSTLPKSNVHRGACAMGFDERKRKDKHRTDWTLLRAHYSARLSMCEIRHRGVPLPAISASRHRDE